MIYRKLCIIFFSLSRVPTADCTCRGPHCTTLPLVCYIYILFFFVQWPRPFNARRDYRVEMTGHPYNDLQYPLIFWEGENGYHLNIKQINPTTGIIYTCHYLIFLMNIRLYNCTDGFFHDQIYHIGSIDILYNSLYLWLGFGFFCICIFFNYDCQIIWVKYLFILWLNGLNTHSCIF
jgi:hypothetical protein